MYKGIVKRQRQKLGHAAASHKIAENRTQPQRHARCGKKSHPCEFVETSNKSWWKAIVQKGKKGIKRNRKTPIKMLMPYMRE